MIAAAAICAVAGAWAIESANVVGYETQNIVDGDINMKGFNFEATDGTSLSLNDLTGTGMSMSDDEAEADQVKLWNNGGYITFAYFSDEGGTWFDVAGDAEPVINPGQSFWYVSYGTGVSGKNIRLAGALVNDSDVTINLVNGDINMIVNPYPASFNMNNTAQVQWIQCTMSDDEAEADQIKVWNNGGYLTFAYFSDEGGTWFDVAGDEEAVVPSGAGFWFVAYDADDGASKKIKFIRPY